MRPVGALLFGMIADRYGRRPALMGSILLYAVVELLSAFSPSLGVFLALRAVFGIGMGGVWGVGASLAMESVPQRTRGLLSGILQAVSYTHLDFYLRAKLPYMAAWSYYRNRQAPEANAAADQALAMKPVSYTHLDVYKRQQ